MPGREKGKRNAKRSNPLGEDLHADRFASAKRDLADEGDTEEDVAGFLIPNRTTQRILKTARQQLEEINEAGGARVAAGGGANEEEEDGDDGNAIDPGMRALLEGAETDRQHEEATGGYYETVEGEDGQLVDIEFDDNESAVSEMPSDVGDMGADMYGIDEEEARLLQKFQPASRVQSRNLADMIMEKIKEKEDGQHRESRAGATGSGAAGGGGGGAEEYDEGHIDSRVARVYTAIGTVMKRYTSGKVPKAFKILPNVKNWEELLMLTKPDQWSPHATYQATRIFAANLNERMAQRFYAAVLLPIVHEHMVEERKLHPALYMAVRKALFKPVAFFKGFLLPLATDEECTLKEALVVASVLQRSHLPPVPTAVTLVKLSQQPFSGPCSVFLRVLIDKKMALPFQAIDHLVAYFHRFVSTHPKEEALPVLWHQTLLSFTQRYKNDLTDAQLALLSNVCSVHFHYLITPEIRRELAAAVRARKVGTVAS